MRQVDGFTEGPDAEFVLATADRLRGGYADMLHGMTFESGPLEDEEES